MDELEHRRAIEHLLEDESLTADLVDQAARLLMDWGQVQAQAVLGETKGAPEEQRTRLNDLRRTIRHIAHQVGQSPPAEQPQRLRAFLDDVRNVAPGGKADEP
jgi:ATP/maltotriose-dependent transcriptional regulator MalT